jgi:hypothetical protein
VLRQRRWDLLASLYRLKDGFTLGLPNVDEHVSVRRILMLHLYQLSVFTRVGYTARKLEVVHIATNALTERVVLAYLSHCLVVELIPAVFESRPYECIVVATVHVATVDKDRVQVVLVDDITIGTTLAEGADVLLAAEDRLEVKLFLESKALVVLDHGASAWVELIPIQRDLKDGRKLLEANELFSILLSVQFRLVLVIASEVLSSNVLTHTLLDSRVTFDVQRDRGKGLSPRRLEIKALVDATDYRLRFALEQAIVSSGHLSALHLLLQCVGKNAVELVNILLLVAL